MNIDFKTTSIRNILGSAALGLTGLMMACNVNAASVNKMLLGSSVDLHSLSTFDDGDTWVYWDVGVNRTLWFEMSPSATADDEFFRFDLYTLDNNYAYQHLIVDIWKPGMGFSAPPPNELAWSKHANAYGIDTSSSVDDPDVGDSYAAYSFPDREVVVVPVEDQMVADYNLVVDMTKNGENYLTTEGFIPGAPAPIEELNKDGTFGMDPPYWYLGLTVADNTELNTILNDYEDMTAYYNTLGPADMSASSPTEPNVVPIPTAFWLFSSAVIGLVGVARRRRTS